MPELKTYDIFISHAWKYGDDYDSLVNLLGKKSLFKFRNYSAPEHKPLELTNNYVTKAEIKSALDRKIRPANIILIISGMYYNNREWMQYELESAVKLNKPIVAIKPRGNILMPTEIQQSADVLVNWNTDSIVDAIRQYSL